MVDRVESFSASVNLETAAFEAGAKRAEKAANGLEEVIKQTQRTAAQPLSTRGFNNALGSVDPIFKAQQEYDRIKQRLESGFSRGLGGDEARQAEILDKLNNKYKEILPNLRSASQATEQLGKSTQLTRFQMLTIQYTINDVIASLASGAHPLTILMQQGGQVTQAWGGLGNTLRALLTPMRLVVAGIAGIGVAVAALISGAEKSESQFKSVEVALAATGRQALLSKTQVLEYENEIVRVTGATQKQSVETLRMLASYRQVGPEMYGKLIQLAGNYATVTQTTVPHAMQTLISGFQKVVPFASELHQKYGLLTQAQYENIKKLWESGKGYEAQNIVLDALSKRIQGLNDNALTPLQKKLRESSAAWEHFVSGVVNSEFSKGLLDFFVELVKTVERIPAAFKGALDDVTSLAGIVNGLTPSFLRPRETSTKNFEFSGPHVPVAGSNIPHITVHPGSYTQIDPRSPEEILAANEKAQAELDRKFQKIIDEQVRNAEKYRNIRNNIETEIQKLKEESVLGGITGDKDRARKEEEFRLKNMVKDLPSAADREAYVNEALKEYDLKVKVTEQTKLLKQAEQERLEAIKSITGTLSNTLAKAFVEGTSAAETFRQFYLKMLEELIAKSILKPIIEPVVKTGFDTFTGAGGGIGSFITNLISGGFAASGASVYPGHSYTVGENGPETFVPQGRGQIVPNQTVISSSSDRPININVNVSGPAASNPAAAKQSASIIGLAIRSEFSKMLEDERRAGGKLWSAA